MEMALTNLLIPWFSASSGGLDDAPVHLLIVARSQADGRLQFGSWFGPNLDRHDVCLRGLMDSRRVFVSTHDHREPSKH